MFPVDIRTILFLSEQVGALQEALNLDQELPEHYRYRMIPEILPIERYPWVDAGQATPTPEDVITWMEGTPISGLNKNM